MAKAYHEVMAVAGMELERHPYLPFVDESEKLIDNFFSDRKFVLSFGRTAAGTRFWVARLKQRWFSKSEAQELIRRYNEKGWKNIELRRSYRATSFIFYDNPLPVVLSHGDAS